MKNYTETNFFNVFLSSMGTNNSCFHADSIKKSVFNDSMNKKNLWTKVHQLYSIGFR